MDKKYVDFIKQHTDYVLNFTLKFHYRSIKKLSYMIAKM